MLAASIPESCWFSVKTFGPLEERFAEQAQEEATLGSASSGRTKLWNTIVVENIKKMEEKHFSGGVESEYVEQLESE